MVTIATLASQTFVIVARYASQTLTFDGVDYHAPADGGIIRVYGTGNVELSGGWWDLATIVNGVYDGPPFSGSTLSATPDVERYAWTGTPDASGSVRETRQALSRPQTDEEYAAVVDPLRRFLHGVAATSGPSTIDQFHRQRADDDVIGQVVEFTLTASRPWVYGVTQEMQLPTSTPSVIQDIEYNLARYPSMELEGNQVESAINYSLNPSAETNITGWSFDQSGVITAAMLTPSRSTELAAVGTASYKVAFVSTTAGTGTITALQTVALPAGYATGTRFSVNMWSAAIISTGTPTLSTIAIAVDWLDASDVVLRTDAVGAVPANGGAATLASILPPAGATKARVSATVTVSSIANGNVVNLFADALAVTIP